MEDDSLPDADRDDPAGTRLLGAHLDLGPSSPLTSAKRLWELSGALTVDGGASPLALTALATALGQLHTATQVTLPVTCLLYTSRCV